MEKCTTILLCFAIFKYQKCNSDSLVYIRLLPKTLTRQIWEKESKACHCTGGQKWQKNLAGHRLKPDRNPSKSLSGIFYFKSVLFFVFFKTSLPSS